MPAPAPRPPPPALSPPAPPAFSPPLVSTLSVSFPTLSLPALTANTTLFRAFNSSFISATAAAASVSPSAVNITSLRSGSIVVNASVAITQAALLPSASVATPADAAAALATALSSAPQTFAALVPQFGAPTVLSASTAALITLPPPFAHSWCDPSKKFCLEWVLVSSAGGAPTPSDPATSVAFRMSGSRGGYVAVGFGPDYGNMVPAEVWTGWTDPTTGAGSLLHGFFDSYDKPARSTSAPLRAVRAQLFPLLFPASSTL